MDLWKFNETKLKLKMKELPEGILKEQAALLEQKTGGVIRGRISNINIHSKCIPYPLASSFDMVIPSLDYYAYTLMVVYSKPEKDYPVAITVGRGIFDDGKFRPEFECNNREEFVKALEEILSSDEVNDKVQILYSKANMQED